MALKTSPTSFSTPLDGSKLGAAIRRRTYAQINAAFKPQHLGFLDAQGQLHQGDLGELIRARVRSHIAAALKQHGSTVQTNVQNQSGPGSHNVSQSNVVKGATAGRGGPAGGRPVVPTVGGVAGGRPVVPPVSGEGGPLAGPQAIDAGDTRLAALAQGLVPALSLARPRRPVITPPRRPRLPFV